MNRLEKLKSLVKQINDANVAGDMDLRERLKAEYARALEPPYHLLVRGESIERAYDAKGRRVDLQTGEPLLVADAKPHRRGRR